MAPAGLSFIAVTKTGSTGNREARGAIGSQLSPATYRLPGGQKDAKAIALILLATILFTFRNVRAY
jgi:hypothetical protein